MDGLKTLRLIPMKGAPRGFANAWPAYAYEFENLIGQPQQRVALEQTQREQNQVRLHPSYRQVVRGGDLMAARRIASQSCSLSIASAGPMPVNAMRRSSRLGMVDAPRLIWRITRRAAS
jgi:hypothetical protein